MVGGDAAALDRARPVLDAMTKGVVHVGAAGAGAAMKLANNVVVAITNEAIAEALLLAEREGIARSAAYDALASGAVASPLLLYKRAAFLDPSSGPVWFTLSLLKNDLELVLERAREHQLDLPATAAAAHVVDAAVDAGFGDDDVARVVEIVG
jgi:3-hydroxyisobutyrate dehydrogenase/2-hydroxy-3-oxopropionate reductase